MKLRELRHLDTVKFRLHALRLRQQVPYFHVIFKLKYVTMSWSFQYKRFDSRYRSQSYDLDVLIGQGKYPAGGIEELQDGIFQLLPILRKWVQKLKNNKIPLTVTDYTFFLKFLMAVLYCLSCQGRPQAYQKITYGEFLSSWGQRRNPSHGNLKNRLSLHYQVLAIVEGPPSEVIDAYIQFVRPRLLEFKNRAHRGSFLILTNTIFIFKHLIYS